MQCIYVNMKSSTWCVYIAISIPSGSEIVPYEKPSSDVKHATQEESIGVIGIAIEHIFKFNVISVQSIAI